MKNLVPDQKNNNKHTQKGMALLESSVEQVGIIESITISNDNGIISGNARHEVIGRKFENAVPILVETDGTRPVIIKRTDINSNTPEFYKASILANTTAKQNISFDAEVIENLVDEYGLNIEELGFEAGEYEPPDPEEKSGYDQQMQWFLNIRCDNEKHCQEWYEKLIALGLDVKIG